jgi:hypothetical protein
MLWLYSSSMSQSYRRFTDFGGLCSGIPRLNTASYERALGAYAANQEIDVATQHNICAANQDTAECRATSVQPIRSEKIKQ